MVKPVVVYLDSQDFSRFSPSHADYEKFLPVKAELIKLKRDGVAIFPFSDIHVFENLPKSSEDGLFGLERVSAIVEMCGQDHFPSSIELMEFELKKLASKVRKYSHFRNAVLSPEWFANIDFPNKDMVDYRKLAKAQLKGSALSRNQRRALVREVERSRGSISDHSLILAGVDDLIEKSPFLESDRSVLVKYLQGKATRADLNLALMRGVRDLASFSQWVVANWEKGSVFVANLRAQNDSTSLSLTKFYDKMRGLTERLNISSVPVLKVALQKAIKDQRNILFKTVHIGLAKKIAGIDLDPEDEGLELNIEDTPCLLSAIEFLFSVFCQSAMVDKPRNPHKTKGSDFADCMHVMFMPKVDVFRADRFSSALLRQSNLNKSTVVADSLAELPTVIVKEIKGVRNQRGQVHLK